MRCLTADKRLIGLMPATIHHVKAPPVTVPNGLRRPGQPSTAVTGGNA